MKLRILTAGAVTVLLSAFTVASTPETDIVGTWKIADESVNTTVKHTIDRIVKANPDAADQIEEHKDEIVDLVKSVRLIYKADKTYESQSAQGNRGGKWEFTNNYKTLKLNRADGTVRLDSVLELSATRMKLINREMADTAVFVHP